MRANKPRNVVAKPKRGVSTSAHTAEKKLAEKAKGMSKGTKIGLGIGAGALILNLLSSGGDSSEGSPPMELQMRLAEAAERQKQAGGGQGNTSKTLKDMVRLLSIMKGMQAIASQTIAPQPQLRGLDQYMPQAGLVL